MRNTKEVLMHLKGPFDFRSAMVEEEDEQKRLLSAIEGVYPTITTIDVDLHLEKNRQNFAYLMFFILGVGSLLPWNTFITAHGYFKNKLCNDQHAMTTFENAFSVGSQIPATVASVVNLYLTTKVPRSYRMAISFSLTLLCFLTTDIFVFVDTATWTKSFFIITLILVIIINICAGIMRSIMYGIAGAAGPQYMQSLVLGISTGGIIVSLMSLLSLATQDDIKRSAFEYFTIASFVVVICIISYVALLNTKLMKFVFKKQFQENNKEDSDHSKSFENFPKYNGKSNLVMGNQTWYICKQIYPQACSCLFVFLVNVALMPSVISNIESINKWNSSNWTNEYFAPLVCFLIYNCGDLAGRMVASYFQVVKATGVGLPLLCFIRIGFIPLFMFSNYQPRKHMPVYFKHDSIPVILNFFLSTSGGYLNSLCLMYAPQQVLEEDQEKAGVIMQLSITVGLCFGAALSYSIVAMI